MSASGNFSSAVFNAFFSSVIGVFLSLCDLLFKPKDNTRVSTSTSQVAFSSRACAWYHFAPGKLSICMCSVEKDGNVATFESPIIRVVCLMSRLHSCSFLCVLWCLVGACTCCPGEVGEEGGDKEDSSILLVCRRVCTLDFSLSGMVRGWLGCKAVGGSGAVPPPSWDLVGVDSPCVRSSTSISMTAEGCGG